RWDTAGNTPPPTARRPPSSASGAAWSAHATATYVAAARKASSRGAPSSPRGHHSPHSWLTRAGGDGNNPRHNTISLTATVYYPSPPWQGRGLGARVGQRHPELPVPVGAEAGLGLRIPAWRVAPEAAHSHLAEQATLDAQTLRALAALLMPLLNDGMS